MARITYLIGAGASAEALPTVKQLTQELTRMCNWLRLIKDTAKIDNYFPNFSKVSEEALTDLLFLLRGCENHMSVDTFCKMLYLTERQEDYRTAKCAIILFFELYRVNTEKFDKRYDAFLATILNKGTPRLPSDINIISWNYDCEFEKAFRNYHRSAKTINDVYDELAVVHKNSRQSRPIENGFGIVKINGTTGFYDEEGKIILGLDTWDIEYVENKNSPQAIFPLLESYYSLAHDRNLQPMISFAWDEDYNGRAIKKDIIRAIYDCEVLVIIGYSFPYFNRELDRYIFSELEARRGVNIYIQDKNAPKLEDTVNRLRKARYTRLQLIEDTDQFYVPHEL